MVLGEFFCRFTGSAAQTHCARRPQLVSKKFLEEEIFASWRLIAKIAKISRYTEIGSSVWVIDSAVHGHILLMKVLKQ